MCSGRQLWILFWILWGTRTSIRLVKQLARHVMAGADERRTIAKANTALPHSGLRERGRQGGGEGVFGRLVRGPTQVSGARAGCISGGHAAEALGRITGDDCVVRFRRMSRGVKAMAGGAT
jgi:hypothetical protein